MTHRIGFYLILAVLFIATDLQAQSDAFDEKIRDATNGLNRYERLQRTEKLLAQNEADMNALKSSLADAATKLKSIDELKKQLADLTKSTSDLKTQVDELKKESTTNAGVRSSQSQSATPSLDVSKNEGLVTSLLNDINNLKEDNSKQLDLNRKLRLDLDAARLELREVSKMVSELNSKVK